MFVRSRYRLAVGQARVCLAFGDSSAAAAWATQALELAEAEHSGLQNHPELGLVDPPEAERGWLLNVARGNPPGDIPNTEP
jgi:hypothetical protein